MDVSPFLFICLNLLVYVKFPITAEKHFINYYGSMENKTQDICLRNFYIELFIKLMMRLKKLRNTMASIQGKEKSASSRAISVCIKEGKVCQTFIEIVLAVLFTTVSPTS